MIENNQRFKVVSLGDAGVGKTCLLVSYAYNKFTQSEMYCPTVFENYNAKVSHNNKIVELDLWDTAGQETLRKLMHLSFVDTDLFLVCFSLIDPKSFQSVATYWSVELKKEKWDKKPVIVVVGTKMDLRRDPFVIRNLQRRGLEPISSEAVKDIAKLIGADGYIETSAKTMEGVKELFAKSIDLLVKREENYIVDGKKKNKNKKKTKKSKKKKKNRKNSQGKRKSGLGCFSGLSDYCSCDMDCDMASFLQ